MEITLQQQGTGAHHRINKGGEGGYCTTREEGEGGVYKGRYTFSSSLKRILPANQSCRAAVLRFRALDMDTVPVTKLFPGC